MSTQQTIFVTGVAGFIGFHVARRLVADGWTVIGLDNCNDYYDPALKYARLEQLGADITFYKGDLEDKGLIDTIFTKHKPRYVCHLAAQAGVRYSIEHPEAYVSSNILGFLNILEACRTHTPEHLVYASSSSVYGNNTEVPFSTQDRVDHPASMYAVSKRTNELMAECYNHLYNIPCTGLRFFTVYGPRQRPDLAIHKFTRAIWEGRPIPQFGDGSSRRDYTYIDDIVQGIRGAVDYDGEKYDVFNLGESETTTLSELIAAIESATGKKAVIDRQPDQPGDMPATWADVSKARRLLGYAPKTKISEGIPKFVDWFRSTVS